MSLRGARLRCTIRSEKSLAEVGIGEAAVERGCRVGNERMRRELEELQKPLARTWGFCAGFVSFHHKHGLLIVWCRG